jgi:hypothetical protein
MKGVAKLGVVVGVALSTLWSANFTSQEIEAGLEAINQLRAEVGVPPLKWSEKLAENAQNWAEKLAETGKFAHSPSNGRYGENIFMAWKRKVTLKDAVTAWGMEKRDYLGGAIRGKNYCKPGKMCGHYTQIVWRKTKEVGCGKATKGKKTYIVCQFAPAGNYVGKKPY